jgi:hypothetical protein
MLESFILKTYTLSILNMLESFTLKTSINLG